MIGIVAVVDAAHPAIFAHFLRHYSALGIERFYCCFHSTSPSLSPAVEECLDLFHGASTGRHTLWLGEPFGSTEKKRHRDRLAQYSNEDGCVWRAFLDVDELYRLTEPAESFLGRLDGCDAVRGIIVDRLAAKGFPTIRGEPDLFAQFPLNAFVTNDLLGAVASKIFFHRSHVPVICPGHHGVAADQVRFFEDWLPCYHFKWDATASERLVARREAFQRRGAWWWEESERFLHDPHHCWAYVAPKGDEITREFLVKAWSRSAGAEVRETRDIRLRLTEEQEPPPPGRAMGATEDRSRR